MFSLYTENIFKAAYFKIFVQQGNLEFWERASELMGILLKFSMKQSLCNMYVKEKLGRMGTGNLCFLLDCLRLQAGFAHQLLTYGKGTRI